MPASYDLCKVGFNGPREGGSWEEHVVRVRVCVCVKKEFFLQDSAKG
jgi:hypothetical protein